ncbi:MAG: nitrogen fixation protein NifQ [Gammaproteobacteria bacterium]|nr:nitrogen fixation protein NifQ [Gammaproteobacteria bacterium]
MPVPATAVATLTVYETLMAARKGDPVEETLARILSSWSQGEGALPHWLGLGEPRFRTMVQRHFPRLADKTFQVNRQAADPGRFDEMDDLRLLLLRNRTHGNDTEAMLADIVVAGSMGADHLWQDLGLWERADLSRLMTDNFFPLAQKNDRDMKWKKFLYKQLCETEGIYTCRSPSCEVCTDYANCFGPED